METTSRRKCRNLSWMQPPRFVSSLDDAIRAVIDQGERSVYVTGEAPASTASLSVLAASGWQVAAETATPTLRREGGGTVRWLSPWTGKTISPLHAGRWWSALSSTLAAVAPGARPMGSPGSTGRDVWLRTIPAGVEYPVMSEAAQAFVRSVAGQGRIEVLPPARETLPALYELDARLAYLGCLSNLPIGEPVTVTVRAGEWIESHPYAPGWARARWAAPTGWKRPGILTANTIRDDAGRPVWPLDGEGWANLAAIRLARAWGWSVTMDRAVAWERTAHPMRTFVRAMTRGLDSPAEGVEPAVWRASWRAMALHTIGAMYAAPRKVTHILPIDQADAAPADAENFRPMPAQGIVRYVTTVPALWPDTHHPEWSATVWERARVRLLDAQGSTGERVGALHVPAGNVVAMRTDALYLTRDPGWRDDGAIGRYRVKRSAAGPHVWPTSQRELLRILDVAAEA